ncbi:MAG TPA: FAD-dependent oxidoreductase [Thermoanaerobaculia bacterium]|jgi:selenide,water dikinase
MKRLLLVGAGHAHLEILRRLILEPLPEVELSVVSLGPLHHYSGMVPGYLQETYREEEIAVRVPDLVRRTGGRFVAGRAVGVEPGERRVKIETAEGVWEVPYDVVSFGVGSNTAGIDAPRVAGEAQRIKPIERVVALRHRLQELACENGSIPFAVVGGGAAGVEISLAIEAVMRKAGRARRITILDSGERILSGYRDRFRERAAGILVERGIEVRTGERVQAVRPDEVETEDGGTVPSRLTVWLTGAVAWPLFQGSGLPLDERGFLLTDEALRSLGAPNIFAAGDCGTLANHPETPKAGVYAVREGPVLWESLKTALQDGEPPRYEPQKGFLSILNTGDGFALLDYRGVVSHSLWAWRLKDWIDRRFMARYQKLV